MFEPIYMKNVDIILGSEALGTNFACQARSVLLNPETNITRIETLCENGQFADVDDPVWTLTIGYLYGRDTVPADAQKALAAYLLANKGTKVPFFFAPKAGGAGYTGTVTLVAGPIGGEKGSFSEQSVDLPVDGQPEDWAGLVGS